MTLQSGRPFTVYYGASANFSGTSNGANGGPGSKAKRAVAGGRVEPARLEAGLILHVEQRVFGDLRKEGVL